MSRAYQLTLLAVIVGVMVSCRDQDAFARRSEQFEVVTEGSASGVTSTVVAPGESPAPLLATPLPITDTNIDTTTSFAILDATTATSGTVQPGTLADTLPSEEDRTRPRPLPRPSPPPPTTETTEPTQPSEPAQPAPAPPAEPPSEEDPQEPPREDKPSEPPPSPPPTTTTSPPRGEVAERSKAGEGREELATS